jgi:hypothetical protein
MVASMKITALLDVAPCSLVGVDQHFRGAYCLHQQGALMTEAVRTSETSVYSDTTRCYIPEGSNLHLQTHSAKPYKALLASDTCTELLRLHTTNEII